MIPIHHLRSSQRPRSLAALLVYGQMPLLPPLPLYLPHLPHFRVSEHPDLAVALEGSPVSLNVEEFC